MAASVFKYLYKIVKRMQGWTFAEQKDKDNLQPILDDLKTRIENI